MMEAITYLIAHIFAQRGFVYHVRDVGAQNAELPFESDLTDSQAALIDFCVNDETMFQQVLEVFDRYEEIKIDRNLSAKPWYDDV